MDNAQKKTLMVALENLLIQRENLNDLSTRSNTLREKMYRTENRTEKEKEKACLTGDDRPVRPESPDIVDLFNNVAGEMQVSIETVRQNINSAIDLID